MSRVIDSPHWLRQRELYYNKTGKLNLSSVNIDGFECIGTRTSLIELNISRCRVDSVEGLRPLPNIKNFIADNSLISSFRGMGAVQNASIVSLKNTPLSKSRHYILGCCIMFPKLQSLDGKLLPEKTVQRASTYPAVVAHLLDLGWEIECPCPEKEILRSLCEKYHITAEEWELDNDVLPPGSEANSQLLDSRFENMYDMNAQMEKLTHQHDKLMDEFTNKFENALNLYGIDLVQDSVENNTEEPPESLPTFRDKLMSILDRYKIRLDSEEETDLELKRKVLEICQKLKL